MEETKAVRDIIWQFETYKELIKSQCNESATLEIQKLKISLQDSEENEKKLQQVKEEIKRLETEKSELDEQNMEDKERIDDYDMKLWECQQNKQVIEQVKESRRIQNENLLRTINRKLREKYQELQPEVEKRQNECIKKLTEKITQIDRSIEEKQKLIVQEENKQLQEEIEDLKLARQLCESKLQEFKNRTQPADEQKDAEDQKADKKPEDREENGKVKSKNTEEENKEIEPKDINKENEENEEMKLKDTNQEEQEFQQKEKQKIAIYISKQLGCVISTDQKGNQYSHSIEKIESLKDKTNQELRIQKLCRKIAGNPIKGLLLQRKVNPIVVKVLQDIGERIDVQEYIEDIKNKKEFSFELTHNLDGLSFMEKWKENKYVRAEEKCGAKIIGKLWDKNLSLPASSKKTDKLLEAIKEDIKKGEVETDILEALGESPKRAKKGKKQFFSSLQADGKNKEVADKYRQNNQEKWEIEELINGNVQNTIKRKNTQDQISNEEKE